MLAWFNITISSIEIHQDLFGSFQEKESQKLQDKYMICRENEGIWNDTYYGEIGNFKQFKLNLRNRNGQSSVSLNSSPYIGEKKNSLNK